MITMLTPGPMIRALILLTALVHGATQEESEVMDRRLPPCPNSPNCVSTLEVSESQAIAPFRYEKSLKEAKRMLKEVISELSRTELVKEEDRYLHYEIRSFLFHFVDIVEFLFDDDSKTIHFRSAARAGYYDFGVNRRRMEEIRRLLEGRI